MSGEHYVNFDILLERVHDRYEAKVIRSPVGETPTRMFDMPLSDIELRNVVLELRNAPELARDVPIAAAPGSNLVREVGSRMFDCIFRDEMLSCLHRSIDYVGWHHNAGLRIRLHFSEAPELARLPWEMLFDRTSRNFLGLTQRTPLVRYIELPLGDQHRSTRPVAARSCLRRGDHRNLPCCGTDTDHDNRCGHNRTRRHRCALGVRDVGPDHRCSHRCLPGASVGR
jgi:hypothetical protein